MLGLKLFSYAKTNAAAADPEILSEEQVLCVSGGDGKTTNSGTQGTILKIGGIAGESQDKPRDTIQIESF